MKFLPKLNNLLTLLVRHHRLLLAKLLSPGKISHGKNFVVGPNLRVARGCTLQVGDFVSIGTDVLVMANVEIGNDVMLSSRIAFIGDDHKFNEPGAGLHEIKPNQPVSIKIGSNILIGYGATLLGNLTIEDGCIIGANSFILKNCSPNMIYIGSPAKALKGRHD